MQRGECQCSFLVLQAVVDWWSSRPCGGDGLADEEVDVRDQRDGNDSRCQVRGPQIPTGGPLQMVPNRRSPTDGPKQEVPGRISGISEMCVCIKLCVDD